MIAKYQWSSEIANQCHTTTNTGEKYLNQYFTNDK